MKVQKILDWYYYSVNVTAMANNRKRRALNKNEKSQAIDSEDTPKRYGKNFNFKGI